MTSLAWLCEERRREEEEEDVKLTMVVGDARFCEEDEEGDAAKMRDNRDNTDCRRRGRFADGSWGECDADGEMSTGGAGDWEREGEEINALGVCVCRVGESDD
jgi:hypothetical protein